MGCADWLGMISAKNGSQGMHTGPSVFTVGAV